MSSFQWYLLAVNVVAFILYTIDFQIYKHGGVGVKPKVIMSIVTIFGGAPGTLIAHLLWDRNLNKKNVMTRIYTLFWLIVQVIVCLALFGPRSKEIQQWCVRFYNNHKVLCIYWLVINMATFLIFAIDKAKAIMGQWRIREALLLGLSLIGGALGGWLAMDLCKHKVQTEYFMAGLPLMMAAHALILLYAAIGMV